MDQISFGTGGWRTTLDNFTDDRIQMVGQAVATYLRETQGQTDRSVAIGYDARKRSNAAAKSLADVLSANGFDVLLTARDVPTPTVAYAVADRNLAGALIVTASHNPPEYNGVKFVPEDTASPLPSVTETIESYLEPPTSLPEAKHGSIERFDPVPAHLSRAINLTNLYFEADLSGLTIVYDAMHGSGRGITDSLLESAGAEVIRRRCERDPTFGDVAPEPNRDTLQGLATAVEANNADLGIANDGDGDRITVCTPQRGVLSGHLLFAGLYEALLSNSEMSGPAVRTVSTTFLIDRIADAYETTVYEVPVGFKWVARGRDEHNALLAGEESGGFTIKNHIGEKDGVFVALLAAAATALEPFDDRLDRLFETYGRIYADKINIDCPEEKKTSVLVALEESIPETIVGQPIVETITLDGFKLLLADGSWILIRPSGTEPKLRVYAETTNAERLTSLLTAGRELIESVIDRDPKR
ncbi:Phosphomannomutase [Haladaptatus litoreus]|uniref:Phosphomannomutase n=1 Tax=Haladaptatus litoreus TaxID=553468 RepID=A0A1N7DIL7_9EURY|nr:phosphoglucomutase [Haladaptatus litoreus]SIR75666.1 Phosphomannomutase [Haladaptatus litoreus]